MIYTGSFRGLTFGNGAGTGLHVGAISGIDDLPDVRDDDLPKAVGAGSFPGTSRLAARRVVLELHLIAATPAAYDTLVDLVVAQTNDVNTLSTLSVYNNKRTIPARPTRRLIPRRTGEHQRTGTAVLEFACPNPTVTTVP